MQLISHWDPNTTYSKLDLVVFDNEVYLSTIDNNQNILPIKVITSGERSNLDTIEQFIYELNCITNNTEWIRI